MVSMNSDLKKELILSKISELDIFSYYLGQFTLRKPFYSPFREENTPSFTVYLSNGRPYYKDWGDSRFSGDCFHLVMQLFNLTFFDALIKISNDFGLGISNSDFTKKVVKKLHKPKERKINPVIAITREFNEREIDYWNQYGLSPDELYAEDIYGIKEAYVGTNKLLIKDDEVAIAYWFPEEFKFKLYFPERQKGKWKWIGNISTYCVEGMNSLQKGEKIIITKSRKDRLVCKKFYPHVINTQNESKDAFTPQLVEILKDYDVHILFDSDEAGIINSKLVCDMFDYKNIIIPKNNDFKDMADMVKQLGDDYAKKFLYEHLKLDYRTLPI